MNTSTASLINDLNKIKIWVIQWKINFNPDPSKQAQEVTFSRKLLKTNHNEVYFNHDLTKAIGLLHKLQAFLPSQSLVTVSGANTI